MMKINAWKVVMETPTACPDGMPFYSTIIVQSFVDICQRKPSKKKKVVCKSSWYHGTALEPVLLGSYRKHILSLHFEVGVIPLSLFRYPISVPWTKRFISQFHSLFHIKKANRVLAKCYPTSPACWSLESPTTNTEIYTGLIAQS